MKKSELFFSALQVPVDYLMLILAGLAAFSLRFAPFIQKLQPVGYQITLREYAETILIAALIFIIVYAIDGLYDIRSTKRTGRELYRIFRGTSIGLMLIIVGVFLDRELFSSRFIILMGGFFAIFFVSFGRIALGSLQRYLLETRELGAHRLLLIGVGGFCAALKKELNRKKDMGYKIIGHIDEIDINRINRIKKLKGIDEIMECTSSANKDKFFALKEYCIRNRIAFKFVPTVLQSASFDVNVFLGQPMIEVKNTPLDGWGKILKRAFDIIGASVGIITFGPIMLIAALASFAESGRPIIFRNLRVGHKGEFDVFKFRYMKQKYCHGKQYSEEHNKKALEYLDKLIKKQSIKEGPLYKIKNDPRKTKVGAILEKLSIDEFPQFFNVLMGNMSLVGPRPHQTIEVEKYNDYHRRVLTIKPGVTGMAQVSGRSDLEFEEEVRLDIYYIENWSLWLDIKIIIKTIPTLLIKRKN